MRHTAGAVRRRPWALVFHPGAALAAALVLAPVPGCAEDSPDPAASAPAAAAAPDRLEAAQLVWSTLIALDQANRTGNYSVLRDLGAPSFREANDPARLAEVFRALRQEDLGLGRTVALVPVYDAPPAVDGDRRLRIRGGFPTRPVGIRFDLAFENWRGTWWLYSISIATAPAIEPPVDTPGGADGN